MMGFQFQMYCPKLLKPVLSLVLKNSIIQTSVTNEKEDGCVKALIKSKPFIIKLLLVN